MPVTKAHIRAAGRYEAEANEKNISARTWKKSDLALDIITAAAEKSDAALGSYMDGIEEVPPDEWDLEMMEQARRENDGETISIEELAAELGISL